MCTCLAKQHSFLLQGVHEKILVGPTWDCDCIPKKCRLNLLQISFQGWCSNILLISAFTGPLQCSIGVTQLPSASSICFQPQCRAKPAADQRFFCVTRFN